MTPRPLTVASLGLAVVLAVGYCCAVRGQPGEARPKRGQDPKEISGFWTEIYREYGANDHSSLFDEWTVKEGLGGHNRISFAPLVWRFGKDTMDVGPNRQSRFPTTRYSYERGVDGRMDAIDMSFLDTDGKALYKDRGIFHLVKDDLLILCYNAKEGPRPERFAGSNKPLHFMRILRRGLVEPSTTWAARYDRIIE